MGDSIAAVAIIMGLSIPLAVTIGSAVVAAWWLATRAPYVGVLVLLILVMVYSAAWMVLS